MTREEIARNFAEKIEKERIRLGFTQKRMAKELQVSLSTYKNIITGVSHNIPIYTAYQVYRLTGNYYFGLCSDIMPDLDFFAGLQNLPTWRRNIIRTFASLEAQLAENEKNLQDRSQDECVVVYVPTGNMEDGMYCDSASVKKVPAGRYQKICHGQIDCGLQITNNSFYPVYQKDDILLIRQKPPRDGDTGIFINKSTKCLYIRRFRQTDKWQLEPLISQSPVITLPYSSSEYLNEWILFGYVLMKMR